jgi:hypothetical protein
MKIMARSFIISKPLIFGRRKDTKRLTALYNFLIASFSKKKITVPDSTKLPLDVHLSYKPKAYFVTLVLMNNVLIK